jgi:hypothetical protein
MKIPNYDPLKNLYPENKTNQQPAVGKEFGTILKETVENAKTEVTGQRPPTVINSLNGIQTPAFSVMDQQFAFDRIENFIGLLDQYHQKLSDPRINLKNIDPIIRKIDQEKENLTPVLDSLPEGEELKNILNRALVTASLEISKFYRGDYIAP